MGEEQCRALLRSGARCSNKVKAAGFCGTHRPVPTKASLIDKIKNAGTIVGTAATCLGLVEQILNIWGSLPFGPSPKMLADYNYLVKKIGPIYPVMQTSYQAFSKGADSVDWVLARQIFDSASEIVESANPPSAKSRLEELKSTAKRFIDTMQPEIRKMLLKKLGSVD